MFFRSTCESLANSNIHFQQTGADRGGRGPPPGPAKISHKKDGHQRWPYRFRVSRPPQTRPLDPLLADEWEFIKDDITRPMKVLKQVKKRLILSYLEKI